MTKPTVLAIDGSAKAVSCALVSGGRLLASASRDDGLTHSVTLLPMIDSLLSTVGENYPPDILAVTSGPGSFTGLRIAVSLVKGLAFAQNLPCVGIMTMEAMAYAAAAAGHRGRAVCVMDARRGEVYNAVFDISEGLPQMFHVKHLAAARAIPVSELHGELLQSPDERYILMGDGVTAAGVIVNDVSLAPVVLPLSFCQCIAYGTALAAEKRFADGEAVSAEELLPFYLRLSQAERLAKE